MKLWKPTLISVLSALTLFNAHAEPKQLDSVAVIVNSGVILQSDVDSALKTIKPMPSRTSSLCHKKRCCANKYWKN